MSVHLGKSFRVLPHSLLRHIHSSLACHCDRPGVVTGLISCSSRQLWPCNCFPLPMWSEKSGKPVVGVNAPEKAVFQSLSKLVSWGIYLPTLVSYDLFASTELTDHHWMFFVKWFRPELNSCWTKDMHILSQLVWKLSDLGLTCPQDLLWIVQSLPHWMIQTALLFRVYMLQIALNWHIATSFCFKMKMWKSMDY